MPYHGPVDKKDGEEFMKMMKEAAGANGAIITSMETKPYFDYPTDRTYRTLKYTPSRATSIPYKYKEDQIVNDIKKYLDSTYGEHYNTDNNVQAFDAWIALGNASSSFRDTAIKYLWRYGKKNGLNKADILKVIHYCVMMLYIDHYKNKGG